jgi:hypothetical protein
MTDTSNLETRKPPTNPALLSAALENKGGWVYDIDHQYADHHEVPPEAIRGVWEVSDAGRFTGGYAPNDRYRAIIRSDRHLKPYMHAAASHNPDEWMVEIDPAGEHLFPDIPKNLVRGWWYIDKDGKITDQFRPNSLHDPHAKAADEV